MNATKLELSKEESKRMLEGLERFREDCLWIDANYQTLLKIYPEEIILVFNKIVVAHGRNMQKLCNRMRKEGNFDPGHCAHRDIMANPPYLCPSIWLNHARSSDNK
jgi:hypothetical protein